MLSLESGSLLRYDPKRHGEEPRQQQFPTEPRFGWLTVYLCCSLQGISEGLTTVVTFLPSPCAFSVLASDIVTSLISVD